MRILSYETGIKDGHEGQPIVRGNRMWVITPFPNELIAFDISNPRAPRHLWTFTPDQDSTAFGKACCDRVNRGGVYYDGRIIYNTLDTIPSRWTPPAGRRPGTPGWATHEGRDDDHGAPAGARQGDRGQLRWRPGRARLDGRRWTRAPGGQMWRA